MFNGRNKGITKPPSPCRQNWMLRALNHRQDITNHTLIKVDSNTDLLDKVILTEVVTRPTKKPRGVGPHKSISKKIDNKKKARLKIKKFRSVNKSLYRIHVDPDDDDGCNNYRDLLGRHRSVLHCVRHLEICCLRCF